MERDNNDYNELYNKFILMYNSLNNTMVLKNNLIHRLNNVELVSNVVNQLQQFNNNPIDTPETPLSEHSDCSSFDNPTLTPETLFEEHPDSLTVIPETPLREYSNYGGYVSPIDTHVSTLDIPETPLREYSDHSDYIRPVDTLLSTLDTPETPLREYSNYGGYVSPVDNLVSTFDTPETPLREYSNYGGYISPVNTPVPNFSEYSDNSFIDSGLVNPIYTPVSPPNEYIWNSSPFYRDYDNLDNTTLVNNTNEFNRVNVIDPNNVSLLNDSTDRENDLLKSILELNSLSIIDYLMNNLRFIL